MALSERDIQQIAGILDVESVHPENDAVRRVHEKASDLRGHRGYKWIGGLAEEFSEIEVRSGSAGLELFARLLLLSSVDGSVWKPACNVPEAIRSELKNEQERIRNEVLTFPSGHYLPDKDAFLKDFSIVRGAAMPVYTGIVDTHTALWRRPLVVGSIGQRLRFLRILLTRPVGTRYFFQHHTHASLLKRFNEEGWNRTYSLIAELLKANSDHKGFCGASWFYDPQLKDVSPRLVYLAGHPLANGADRFHLGLDDSGSALSKSETRLKLYESGKYVPQSYVLVWPKKAMIASA
jgi:hypothetical protein